MRKIEALAFAKWYYENFTSLQGLQLSDTVSTWEKQKESKVKELYESIDNATDEQKKEEMLQIWSLIPFFLITAHYDRPVVFKRIFNRLWTASVGIIEIDVFTHLSDRAKYAYLEKEEVYNQEPLTMIDYVLICNSVFNLKRSGWALFKFTAEVLSDLSQNNNAWSNNSLATALVPDDQDNLELISSVKCAISGDPRLLKMY